MSIFGLFLDVIIYNIMINGLCRVNEVNKVFELFEKVKLRNDILFDVVIYVFIIFCFCKLGKMEEVFFFF